jgi:acyl-CoA synthetase (AMP-forming)/AMP-acid ligase II
MAKTSIDEATRADVAGDPPRPLFRRNESGVRRLSFLPDRELTFADVFAARCAEEPERIALHDTVVFARDDIRARPFTFAELEASARRAAAGLEASGVRPGDRVLLCLSNSERFFSFFLAVQALGAVPVPLPSISDFHLPAAFRERITAVALDCSPVAIVADGAQDLELVSAGLSASVKAVDAGRLTDDALPPPNPSENFSLRRSLDEIAFVQYTSGSTGTPKGVVITHRNLIANMHAITEAAGFGPEERSVFWLPLYHDMGLVGGLLLGVYLAIPTYVLSPKSFVTGPDTWLRAISQFKGTFTVGPNFAYSILAKRLPDAALAGLDLSHFRLAFNGAEPIDRATVEAFIRRFEPCGFRATSFYPVYGMAESTLAVAFPAPGSPVRYDTVDREGISTSKVATPVADGTPGAVSFVSVGRAMPGHRISIRAPESGKELGERCLGEIVVEGPSVSPRYFSETAESLLARTELRTGDLGYVADGELYVVDRLKDLLIVAGRNLLPSDLERVAATVPGTRYGAIVAFAKPGPDGTDELYFVVGVEPRAMTGADEIRAEVRSRVFRHFGVNPREVVVVLPGDVPKTSSGKVRRSACRALHDAGAFTATALPHV